MQTRSRVLLLVGMAAIAGLAIAVGFSSQRVIETSAPGDDPEMAVSNPAVIAPAETTVNATVPAVPETDPRDAHALVHDARRLIEQGHAADAEPLAVRATEAEPENTNAWNVLGRAQLALNRPDDAEVAFKHACAVDSSNAYAYNNLGLLYLQRGASKDAVGALETAVRLKDDVGYFHNNLGLAYERTGRLSEAAQAYGAAVELQPGHATAGIALARVTARLAPAVATVTAPQPDSVASALVTQVKP